MTLATSFANSKNLLSEHPFYIHQAPKEPLHAVRTPEILNHVANAWLSCKPLLDAMMPKDREQQSVGDR
jgi:hypothetical protein